MIVDSPVLAAARGRRRDAGLRRHRRPRRGRARRACHLPDPSATADRDPQFRPFRPCARRNGRRAGTGGSGAPASVPKARLEPAAPAALAAVRAWTGRGCRSSSARSTLESGRVRGHALLERAPDVTAVLAFSDARRLACGARRASGACQSPATSRSSASTTTAPAASAHDHPPTTPRQGPDRRPTAALPSRWLASDRPAPAIHCRRASSSAPRPLLRPRRSSKRGHRDAERAGPCALSTGSNRCAIRSSSRTSRGTT